MARARIAGVIIIFVVLLAMVAPQLAVADAMDKPINDSPIDGATEIGPGHIFQVLTFSDADGDTAAATQWQWRTASAGTDNYSLPLYDSGIVAASQTATYPLGVFDYGKTYYWHMRVQNNHGQWSAWSDETSFTVITNSPPSQPENFEPDDSATAVALPVTLVACEFRDPNAAELVLGEKDTHAASRWQVTASSDNYSSPVFDSGLDTARLTSIFVPLGRLSENTTYYWHVRYQDSYGNWSAYSPQTSFTTGTTADVAAVQAPVNVSPYNGATEISPDQKLKASEFVSAVGSTHYASRWQVAASGNNLKNPDGSYQQTLYDSSIDVYNKVQTSLPVGLVDYEKTYYWHVRYQDDAGSWSAWSAETSFTLVANLPPSNPRNLEPSDGKTGVEANPILQASSFSDPDMSAYMALTDSHSASQWQVTDNAGTYATPIWDSGEMSATTSVQIPKGKLLAGTKYYWHVKYEDSRGNWSGWSQETSFTTKALSVPTVSFTVDKTEVTAGEDLVTFSDNSTPLAEIDRWTWDFGDNTTEMWNSDNRTPNGKVSHKYTTDGTYTAKLTVFNGAAPQGQEKTMKIVVHARPEASFTVTPAGVKAGKEITFTDGSSPTADITSWEWQLDDGTVVQWTRADRDAAGGQLKHAFKTSGTHTCTLIVKGPLGESYYNKQVNVGATGGFKFGLWMVGVAVAVVVLVAGVVYLIRARRAK